MTDSINNLVTLGDRITRGFLTATLCNDYYVECVNHNYALILHYCKKLSSLQRLLMTTSTNSQI